ncbi:MAG: 3-isopropylmalate dehydratase [Oscillospiraceae bacterium]|nr:3-isopropylmalate dehydratase [Oscillospiraceae bacterium]MCI9289024.1 3-isopropylmalate dehydratase [Oscillospiraceae bacterium]MCI9550730.1 3-isopropylmalate dehydratase [Oscillospiraceae bacterium]
MIRGKVWKFGDDINTDIISPGEYMDASYEEIGKHAMERAFPGFADAIEQGDIIVAGKNFGPGSSRETAQIALLYAGVGGVIAKDFARIFFRNCINVGFPVVTFDGTDELNQGDEIVVDLLSGRIENITTGKVYFGSRLPQHVLSIVEDGGLKNHLKKTLKKG